MGLTLFTLGSLLCSIAPSLGWLFVGRLISGATSGVFSTANAYVADVTPQDKRARAFGWMGAAFTIGFGLWRTGILCSIECSQNCHEFDSDLDDNRVRTALVMCLLGGEQGPLHAAINFSLEK